MDGRVQEKIVDLTNTGVRRLSEMKRRLPRFVVDQLFHDQQTPSFSDAHFGPVVAAPAFASIYTILS